jgi:hypothetical protein
MTLSSHSGHSGPLFDLSTLYTYNKSNQANHLDPLGTPYTQHRDQKMPIPHTHVQQKQPAAAEQSLRLNQASKAEQASSARQNRPTYTPFDLYERNQPMVRQRDTSTEDL